MNKTLLHILFLIIITALVFYPSLFCEFVSWDDPYLIEKNPLLHSLSLDGLKKMFGEFYWYNYQPLTLLSFAVECHFFNINPFVIHLDNILLHILNTILVYKLMMLLSEKNIVAFITAVLFAIHPMHVESVTWASERKDVLYSFFFLLSLIYYLKYLKKSPVNCILPNANCQLPAVFYYSLSLLFFLLACLSKGMAVSLSLTIIAVDYFMKRKLNRNAISDKIPFFIISLVFGLLVVSAVRSENFPIIDTHTFLEKTELSSKGFLFYLLKAIFPFNLTHYYPYPYATGYLPSSYWLFPFVAAGITLFVFSIAKKNRILFFGFTFFLANIIFVLQLLQTNLGWVAEHYTYIPYIGIFYMVAEGFHYLFFSDTFVFMQRKTLQNQKHQYFVVNLKSKVQNSKSKIQRDYGIPWDLGLGICLPAGQAGNLGLIGRLFLFLLISVLAFLGFYSHQRTYAWKNGLTLWKDAEKRGPSSLVYYNIGNVLREKKEYDRALYYYAMALKTFSASETILSKYWAYVGFGSVMEIKGNHTEALDNVKKAVKLLPKGVEAYIGLAIVSFSLGDTAQALAACNTALRYRKINCDLFYTRGTIYAALSDYEKALSDFNRAIELFPYESKFFKRRGDVFSATSRYDRAMNDYNRSIGLDPAKGENYFARGRAHLHLKDTAAACSDFFTAMNKGDSASVREIFICCRKNIPGFLQNNNKNNLRLTLQKDFYKNGRIKFEIVQSFENDRILRKLLNYDSLGNLYEEGMVNEQNKYNGAITWYFPGNKIKMNGSFHDTVPFGEWKEYYETGLLKAEYGFDNGAMDGDYKYYHANGSLWTERLFKNGKLMKIISNFDSHGSPLEPGTLKNGNGTVNVYDENGALVQMLLYRNGIRMGHL